MATVDTSLALVTLVEGKEKLKITASSEDSILGVLINGVSQAIKKYTGRNFISASYTQFYDGDGTDELQLANYPVTALTTLNDDVNRDFASGDDISSDDYLLDGPAGIVRLWNTESVFIRAKANVKVVYTAGYTVANIPADLKLAALRWIAREYMKFSDKKAQVVLASVRDQNITYDVTDIPADVKATLDRHRVQHTAQRFF